MKSRHNRTIFLFGLIVVIMFFLFRLVSFHRSCVIYPEEFVHRSDDSLLVLLAFGLLFEIVIIDGCIFYRFDLSQILYHKIA